MREQLFKQWPVATVHTLGRGNVGMLDSLKKTLGFSTGCTNVGDNMLRFHVPNPHFLQCHEEEQNYLTPPPKNITKKSFLNLSDLLEDQLKNDLIGSQ